MMLATSHLPKIIVVPTTPDHIRKIADKLRSDDRREVLAIGHPNRVLWRSYKRSIMTKTAFIDGKIAAIWGVGGSPLGNIGEPWLLTTKAVNRISPLAFVRIYQKEVIKMMRVFPKLVNYVDFKYNKAIRLLDIIGFKMGDPEIMGVNGELFIRFEMEK